ncbi:MAG: S-layer homology domain-containing protein, partial [Desulfotomaculaceae bacterium]|nr:S-layer homology domain-containing protein [Desulfotomaculaceae bacterium]
MRAKRKIAIVVCLLIGLVLFVTGAAMAAAMPSDIQGHWAEQQIREGINEGVIEGYPDGTFRPDNYVTRAEFVTLVNRFFGFIEKAEINFNDVSSTDWFYEEIAKGVKAGSITGYPDGSMRPNNYISCEEAAAILTKLHNLQIPENFDAINKFDDFNLIPEWSKQYINAVVVNCLMIGYPDNTLRPARFISRAETVVMLLRDICEPDKPIDSDNGDDSSDRRSGGGGGGGGDRTAPRLIAATFTLHEGGTYSGGKYEGGEHNIYDVVIEKNKNDFTGSVDFSNKDPYSWITSGTITVSEKPVTLALTEHNAIDL